MAFIVHCGLISPWHTGCPIKLGTFHWSAANHGQRSQLRPEQFRTVGPTESSSGIRSAQIAPPKIPDDVR